MFSWVSLNMLLVICAVSVIYFKVALQPRAVQFHNSLASDTQNSGLSVYKDVLIRIDFQVSYSLVLLARCKIMLCLLWQFPSYLSAFIDQKNKQCLKLADIFLSMGMFMGSANNGHRLSNRFAACSFQSCFFSPWAKT